MNRPSAAVRVLQRAFGEARGRHGDLGLTLEAFSEAIWVRVDRRMRRLGDGADAADAIDALERTALQDLYVTIACDVGSSEAWNRLAAVCTLPLVRAAQFLGAAEPEELAQDVIADLALPDRSGISRTVIGTFDGSGSVHAWMKVILRRRLIDQTRSRSAEPAQSLQSVVEGESSRREEPSAFLMDEETSHRLAVAFRNAWNGLPSQARLVLILKFRDGLRQREIARVLALSESRISRISKRAIRAIRKTVLVDLSCDAGPSWTLGGHLGPTLSRLISQQLDLADAPPETRESPAQGDDLREAEGE